MLPLVYLSNFHALEYIATKLACLRVNVLVIPAADQLLDHLVQLGESEPEEEEASPKLGNDATDFFLSTAYLFWDIHTVWFIRDSL